MAKGKTVNPADAHRKAIRKKELKKNKTERSKARDFALVKKDTRDLEEDIEKLEGNSDISPADASRLQELKEELAKITKKKEDYVTEHPEHRKLVFRSKRNDSTQESEPRPEPKSRKLFNKNGLPRHPERSIYYDPVMNPYGVPPPGMPYVERALRPEEVDSDQDDMQGDSDDGIAMPVGPPPGRSDDNDEDSDDDIPMPDGPPPPKYGDPSVISLPPSVTAVSLSAVPPLPPIPGPPPGNPPFPPPPHMIPGPPPLPHGHYSPMPPPPSPFFSAQGPSLHFPNMMPPPPPGFFPRRNQSVAAMQDPLSSIPHETFQAHRASVVNAPPHPSLPPKPVQGPPSAAVSIAATVSAAPQLRDLKKESTAFVPSTLKRKKAGTAPAASQLNAAPSVGLADESDSVSTAPRPNLLSTLRGQLGTGAPTVTPSQKKPKPGDDYTKFMDEMGDILGPTS